MLLTKKFITNAVTAIISPHGMTDYIHAKKFGFLSQLYKINLGVVSSGFVLDALEMQTLIHVAFLVSSIIHFRNDMPLLEFKNVDAKSLQVLTSSVFVGSMHFLPSEYFVLYMLFIHTPNHYRMAWNYVKDNLEETLVLVIGIGIILNQLNTVEDIPHYVMSVIQTLVISHIIYQEKYVFSEYKELLNKTKIDLNKK